MGHMGHFVKLHKTPPIPKVLYNVEDMSAYCIGSGTVGMYTCLGPWSKCVTWIIFYEIIIAEILFSYRFIMIWRVFHISTVVQ